MKRVLIVADSSLIVESIRAALRKSNEFAVLGHADGRGCSAATIAEAAPDVVLVDDMGHSDLALSLVESIRACDERTMVLLLTVRMDEEWLHDAFAAGAHGAISKAIRPAALATLVRETVDGHVVHFSPSLRAAPGADENHQRARSSLTDRELTVLQFATAGFSNGEIARQLSVTEQTVKFHLSNIYRKLEVANRTQASHWAHRHGVLDGLVELASTG
jgi:DNA-binding NarL/FixJ family response regulator